ncbi:MAG: hypothetical protein VZR76_03050 [Candidatus Enteromonas sp.]|jgi:AcrR family transcriptional regulator|nr:hypothetical protein [Bacilli bacterium]MEE3401974.1 hypothetical protein [Candidatus Enteromonas sp.]MBQ2053111.1 hypothetical protein [Bacilli bacterium]MBQ4182134.1 hypothetical protein [Bacilli bacterium]MEE3426966.1 hypothetical protein [Candidatus Enteromonas sp.]
MTTESKFKVALKALMTEKSIDDISVTILCKKCGCHRQTFYYHYTDIYDLIADILLNENLGDFEKATTVPESLSIFLEYLKENFSFYRATYISAAHDLPDEFIFGKLRTKFLDILSKNRKNLELKKLNDCRAAARRFARIVSDEFGDCFKESNVTPEKFKRRMSKFSDRAVNMLLPTIINMSREEDK